MSAESKKRDAEYRAEDDLRTLKNADEIRADKSRANAAKRVAQKQLRALRKISGK